MSLIENKEHHKMLVDMIRKAEKLTNAKCGLMIDLMGPVIRTAELKDNKSSVQLKAGQEFRFVCKRKYLGDETFIGLFCNTSVDFPDLESKLKIGDHIILDFGAVCLKVIGFEDEHQFLVSKQLDDGGLEMIKTTNRPMRMGGRGSVSF